MSDALRRDDRGLALGFVIFFAMLILGALLYALMNSGMTEVFALSKNMSTSQGATDQINMAQAIWNNLLFAILILSMVYVIARAVREGRGP